MIYKADFKDREELFKELQDKARWKWFDFSRDALTNCHAVIELENVPNEGTVKLNAKIPKISGEVFIRWGRPRLERLANNAFLAAETKREAIYRESETYKRLQKEGFPTLTPRQDLLKETYIDNVLLTEHLEGYTSLKMLLKSPKMIPPLHKTYLQEAAGLLARAHNEHNLISGDCWLGNFAKYQGQIYMHDFELKPNPDMPIEMQKAKDLISLTANAACSTRKTLPVSEVVDAILESYNPTSEFAYQAEEALENEGPFELLKNAFYFTVYGRHHVQVREIKDLMWQKLQDIV